MSDQEYCLCSGCGKKISIRDNGHCSECVMKIQEKEAIAYNKRQAEGMQRGDNTIW